MAGVLTHRTSGRRRGRAGAGAEHVNVTPLIDVVMVLIIFYLMVGSLISSDYSEVPLPYATHGQPAAEADVYTINIIAGGPAIAGQPGTATRAQIVVRGAPVDAAFVARDLGERLASDPKIIVQLRAARDLPYRAVEPVVKACARAGATTIRLITEAAG